MIKTVGFDGLNPPVLNPTIAYQESPLWHQGSRLISGMGLCDWAWSSLQL